MTVERSKPTDRLKRLYDLRDVLTERLAKTRSDHASAAIAGQLRDTLTQIEECEKALPAKEATPLDELRAKRAARETPRKTPAKGAKSRRGG